MIELSTICVPIPSDQKREIQFCRTHHPLQQDEAPLQLAAVQLSHCVWGLHAWGPRGSDRRRGNCSGSGSLQHPPPNTHMPPTCGPPLRRTPLIIRCSHCSHFCLRAATRSETRQGQKHFHKELTPKLRRHLHLIPSVSAKP